MNKKQRISTGGQTGFNAREKNAASNSTKNAHVEQSDSPPVPPVKSGQPVSEVKSICERVRAKVSSEQKQELFWYGQFTGYGNGIVPVSEYFRRVKDCLESGDNRRINAAVTAMRRTLGMTEDEASAWPTALR